MPEEYEVAAPAEVETSPVSAEKEPEDERYTLGTWNNYTQWRCAFCPWDTLRGRDVMLQHFVHVHVGLTAQPEAPRPVMYDRFGNRL
jgi:hypothetical protein